VSSDEPSAKTRSEARYSHTCPAQTKKCQKRPTIGANETYYVRTFENLPDGTHATQMISALIGFSCGFFCGSGDSVDLHLLA